VVAMNELYAVSIAIDLRKGEDVERKCFILLQVSMIVTMVDFCYI